MEGMPGYWLFRTSPESGGGIGVRGETVGDAVRVYIDVDDLEGAVEAATANGGSVITPPSDIPGQGRFAAVRDPEGNEIGLYHGHPRLTPLVDSHCHLNADRFESDADQVVGAARLAGLERILVPGWNVASSERALACVERFAWLDAAVGVHPHDAAKVDEAGWGRIVGWAAGPAGRRDRRDRARLRPGVQPGPGPADEPAAEPGAGARDGQAGDPALPLGRGPARRAGRAGRRSCARPASAARPGPRHSATGRRRSSTRSPGRSTTRGRSSTSGSPISFSGLVFRAGEEASAEVAAIVPADRVLVETDSPFLAPPGAPRSRNEPEWVRVTAAWLAERRATTPDALGADLVAAYDRTFPSERTAGMTLRRRSSRSSSGSRSSAAGPRRRPARRPTSAPSRGASRRRPVRGADFGPAPPPCRHPRPQRCVVEPQTGILPSDRMSTIEVLGLPGRDVIRFNFGESSIDQVGVPRGALDVAVPPFIGGSSGLPMDVHGEHVLEVVFKGMSLQNDVGQPTFEGPREVEATDPARALRHVVLYDEFEGQMGWYIGYDGAGCLSLSREGDSVVLAIDFGPGS